MNPKFDEQAFLRVIGVTEFHVDIIGIDVQPTVLEIEKLRLYGFRCESRVILATNSGKLLSSVNTVWV